ncbi:MAG TPA: Gamma-glutamyltranspeptidase [Acidiferrobacteraceae bacterium]|nr:Gamma-glutamyltranspeptidase [Acidiferrobacteraceae bacterium]
MVKGVIAAGHQHTAEAAAQLLDEGGNAYDAIVAAGFTACVVEPVFASLGGGGFLVGHHQNGDNCAYDFFVQTPLQAPAADRDFYPIVANFGTAQQEFHIGLGSVAVPGVVKGLFAIHRDLGQLPMAEVMAPAIQAARQGIRLNSFQGYFFRLVRAIYLSTPESRRIFGRGDDKNELVGEGDLLTLPDLAATLEALLTEGDDLFYKGEIGQKLAALHGAGGAVSSDDLEAYRTIKRKPFEFRFRNNRILTNPPPASGGIMVAFAMDLLSSCGTDICGPNALDCVAYLAKLARVMAMTDQARMQRMLPSQCGALDTEAMFEPEHLDLYRQLLLEGVQQTRGTTQISIADGLGNVASMGLSNGEGCGHVIPGTGIVLNNMLGEQDICPFGFVDIPTNQRMSSMMAPTLAFQADGAIIATGSGGSNRIRTTVLQVLMNLLEFGMLPIEAVESPRIHFEDDQLQIEGGYSRETADALAADFKNVERWQGRDLFFGGAHTVRVNLKQARFEGAGDSRRAGVSITV